jgi:hypothetical protein
MNLPPEEVVSAESERIQFRRAEAVRLSMLSGNHGEDLKGLGNC